RLRIGGGARCHGGRARRAAGLCEPRRRTRTLPRVDARGRQRRSGCHLRVAEGNGGMSVASNAIVGVDVGGTFTDFFWYDEAARAFRTAKVPSQRGDEAS